MKKHFYSFLIFIISLFFIWINVKSFPKYLVVDIPKADIICVDINRNLKCDKNENIKLYGISSFPEKFGKQASYLSEKYSLKEEDFVVLSVMAKDFCKKELLNKYINLEILDEFSNENYRIAKIYLSDEDFSKTLVKSGFAYAIKEEYKIFNNFGKIKKNINLSKKFNYKIKNLKNGKIHKLDCKYGKQSKNYEIKIIEETENLNLCNFCHPEKQEKNNKNKISKNFDYETENIKVYFLDFTTQLKPDFSCSTKSCKILLDSINNSQKSIDFAIYGLGNIPKISEALIKASERGVKIRYIIDENSTQKNYYKLTENLNKKLYDYKTDFKENETQKFNNFIMHNKFFIFDDSLIWTGTANVSETDLSGFNANNVLLIKSKELALTYKKEFEQMYSGDFHTYKNKQPSETILVNNIPITVTFSPQDNIITTSLIPLIKNAQKSIYINSYIITHKSFAQHLIEAKKRGVDVKIIVDATSAKSPYSMIKQLRINNIPTKIENFAGKMHMKTIVIDEKYFITGSMNFTKSGESYNDENTLFIEDKNIALKGKMFFEYLWNIIPEKYLTKYISAESKYSIGSCSDGIDNDYDKKIDSNDDSCK